MVTISQGPSMSPTLPTASLPKKKNHDHVISTIPLGALSIIDTSKCNFDPKLPTSIGALHYDSCVKVAIQFTERWWENLVYTNGHPHKGGVSSTDQHPSYGIDVIGALEHQLCIGSGCNARWISGEQWRGYTPEPYLVGSIEHAWDRLRNIEGNGKSTSYTHW